MTRRSLLGSALAAVAAEAATGAGAEEVLPAKAEFPVTKQEVCLNNARWHPASEGAMREVRKYLEYKASGGGAEADYSAKLHAQVKGEFAKLIGAKASEIAFVPSTTVGENLVGSAIGLGEGPGAVVTDALHFEGSLYQYGEMKKRGLEVRMLRPKGGRIEMAEVERAVGKGTKLVAVSLVSMINGFEYDLKALCEVAHAGGALVFVDAVQAAGAVPIDVKATGVDFLASSSYKWLMGDMGLGFLYVKEDALPRLKRAQYGFRQLAEMQYHVFPHDPPGAEVMNWRALETAAGYFEVGTVSNTTAAALDYSLPWINRVGVAKIQAWRKPLLERLRKEMPRLGFEAMTPEGAGSAIVTFAKKDSGRVLGPRLMKAKVDVAVYEHRVRISPSVYNDMGDVEKLLDALG